MDQTLLQAAVEAIPFVGGSLNAILSGVGQQRKERRVLEFLWRLRLELSHLQQAQIATNPDDLAEFLTDVVDRVARSRSAEKRARFARLVKIQVLRQGNWDQAEAFCRLLDDLLDLHIEILATAANAPACDEPFDGLRVIALSDWPPDSKAVRKPIFLLEKFKGAGDDAVRMACSDLFARGLLRDEGIGRWDGKAMTVFVATSLGLNFLEWIDEPAAATDRPATAA